MKNNNEKTNELSVKTAAEQLNVSITTIHNWLKEGTLTKTKGRLTQHDIEVFKQNYLFKNKLSSRANKQYKDLHDHNLLSDKISHELNSGISVDEISEQYEMSLSESYKNKEGIYYTPQHIVADMMKDICDVKDKLFLDPCCGSGNFLIEAIKKGFAPENVFGYDIDENAVAIAKKRIKELCGYETQNIVCADFLEIAINSEYRYDYIMTNPPWGKKIRKNDKNRYSLLYNSGNSTDTAALFFFASLKLLKNDALIAFLMPESFFKISSFEDARKSLLKMKITRLIDYDKPFKGLLTKAMAFVAYNREPKDNIVDCEIYAGKKHKRTQSSFLFMPKHILNFDIDEKGSNIIRHVFSLPHITLKDNAKWALGIITGNNAKLCHKIKGETDIPIFRGKDISKNKISEPVLFVDKDLQNCRQVADISLYEAEEKIVYRFISNKIVCCLDKEQRYILNSANMFILNDDFPLTHEQVCVLLNSDFMNWLYKSIFNTHKVLRGDLEMMPLWHGYFEKYETFSDDTLMEYLEANRD